MAEIFTLEVLPARKGDCLLIHYGDTAAPKLVIVDGGPSQVYQSALRPRLEELHKERALDRRDALPVELLLVSHLDDDHINGVLELAEELENDRRLHQPALLSIQTLWHNSFDEIIGNNPPQLDMPETAALASFGMSQIPNGTDHDIEKVLASIAQGHRMRKKAEFLKWEINAPFVDLVMNEGAVSPEIDRFGGGLTVTVLGPMLKQLAKLQKKYDKFLADKEIGRENPEAALATLSKDRSVANLSSIAALFALGGKRILLTGDALGEDILAALSERGLASEAEPLQIDILKMQHHGSDRNVTPEFFRRIKARHYVFCGDGEHGNPERQTLEWLFAGHSGEAITLHFTYPIDVIDAERRVEAEKKNGWVEERDSLRALFDTEATASRVFEVSTPISGGTIRIGLMPEASV